MVHRAILAGILIASSLFLVSCGDDDDNSPTNTPTNSPPNAPVNDTASGSPADNAAGVAVNTILYWTCSDPDGDTLIKYDVYCSETNPPSIISTGQYAVSLGPLSLAHSTEYFWYVLAEDPSGETAQSAIYSFTTAD